VIVDDLDFITITVLPGETDSDLIIDPDAMLSFSVSLQSFKTVSWGYQQVCQLGGVVEHSQLPPRKDLQLPWVPPHLETVPYATCILRSKGTNHVSQHYHGAILLSDDFMGKGILLSAQSG
jgi:hypothetical protein